MGSVNIRQRLPSFCPKNTTQTKKMIWEAAALFVWIKVFFSFSVFVIVMVLKWIREMTGFASGICNQFHFEFKFGSVLFATKTDDEVEDWRRDRIIASPISMAGPWKTWCALQQFNFCVSLGVPIILRRRWTASASLHYCERSKFGMNWMDSMNSYLGELLLLWIC